MENIKKENEEKELLFNKEKTNLQNEIKQLKLDTEK